MNHVTRNLTHILIASFCILGPVPLMQGMQQPELKALDAQEKLVVSWWDQDARSISQLKADVVSAVVTLKIALKSAVTCAKLGRKAEIPALRKEAMQAIKNLQVLITKGQGHDESTRNFAVYFNAGLENLAAKLQAIDEDNNEKDLIYLDTFATQFFAAFIQKSDQIIPIQEALADTVRAFKEQETARKATQELPTSVGAGVWALAKRYVLNIKEGDFDWMLTDQNCQELSACKEKFFVVVLDLIRTDRDDSDLQKHCQAIFAELKSFSQRLAQRKIPQNADRQLNSLVIRDHLKSLELLVERLNNLLVSRQAVNGLSSRDAAIITGIRATPRCKLGLQDSMEDIFKQSLAAALVNTSSAVNGLLVTGKTNSEAMQKGLARVLKFLKNQEHKAIVRSILDAYNHAKSYKGMIKWCATNLEGLRIDPKVVIDFVNNDLLGEGFVLNALADLSEKVDAFKSAYTRKEKIKVENAIELVYDVLKAFGISDSIAKLGHLFMKHGPRLEQMLKVVDATDTRTPERIVNVLTKVLEKGRGLLQTTQSILGGVENLGIKMALSPAAYAQTFDLLARESMKIDERYQDSLSDPRGEPENNPGFGLGGQPAPATTAAAAAAATVILEEKKRAAARADEKTVADQAATADTKALQAEQKAEVDKIFGQEDAEGNTLEKEMHEQQKKVDHLNEQIAMEKAVQESFEKRVQPWTSWWRLKLGSIYAYFMAPKATTKLVYDQRKEAERKLQELAQRRHDTYVAQKERAEKIRTALSGYVQISQSDLQEAFATTIVSREWRFLERQLTSINSDITAAEDALNRLHDIHRVRGWGLRSCFNWLRRQFSSRYVTDVARHEGHLTYLKARREAIQKAIKSCEASKEKSIALKDQSRLETRAKINELCCLSPVFEMYRK